MSRAAAHVNGFTVVSLFAGAGGSSLGYRMAGGRVVAAVEWWPAAAETYRANFPDVPVIVEDIALVESDRLAGTAGVAPGELDILDGSPPCQGFSTSGNRRPDDPRNRLFAEYVRILAELRPKVLVMENVRGLILGWAKWYFAAIVEQLEGCGYRIGCWLTNAMWFGVPQDRARVIFIGTRYDLGIEPSIAPPGTVPPAFAQVYPWAIYPPRLPFTVGEAIGHLPRGEPVDDPDIVAKWHMSVPGRGPTWDETCRSRLHEARLARDRVARTQTHRPQWHWAMPRRLTIKERALLQSFPDTFQWPKPAAAQALIGNAVPPLMMAAIAGWIRDHILARAALGGP